jgi:uncharacterized membrane protein
MSVYRRVALALGPFVLQLRENIVEGFAVPYIALDLTALLITAVACLVAGFMLLRQANEIAMHLLLFLLLAALSATLSMALAFIFEHVTTNYAELWSFVQSMAFDKSTAALNYFNFTQGIQ